MYSLNRDISTGIELVTAASVESPLEGDGKPASPPFDSLNIDLVDLNWEHRVVGDRIRVFAVSNPFFITQKEMEWLIAAGKEDNPFDLVNFLSSVTFSPTIERTQGYIFSVLNWVQFWQQYK